ncbi:GDSL-type esterase/lipase family protein [Rhodospirillum sp. A1_3_36]|uniref:GDSL-type esterase/lipase family protein n=1 Tax=Rhodospirillum sp. A1_3_36 TaxID=3391666 RepID=UPI0039A6539A
MKKVCFFGDSFTHGIGDEMGWGWVGRLTEASTRGGHDFSAFNLGLPQETTPQLMERWRSEAERRMRCREGGSGGLVFCFGLDDMADFNDEGIRVALPQSMALAERLVAEAVTLYPCLWVGPPPARSDGAFLTDEGGCVRYRWERLAALNLAYRRIAEDLQVPYLDLHGDLEWDSTLRRAHRINGALHASVAGRMQGWEPWRSWFGSPQSDPVLPILKARKEEFEPFHVVGGFIG